MKAPLTHRLDQWARRLSPAVLTAFLVVLGVVPLPLPEFGTIAPTLAVMAVYHWAIFRPELLPPAAAFAIGLLDDILRGMPLGVSALTLLLLHGFVRGQRRLLHGRSFFVLWLGFLIVAAGASLLQWFAMLALGALVLDPGPAAFQVFMTAALYPCLAWLLSRAQLAFLEQD